MFILGAGIAMTGSYLGMLTLGVQNRGVDQDDALWKTVTIGGAVTFEIPVACALSVDSNDLIDIDFTTVSHLVCPTEENPTPTPEMTFWSGISTINVRRYENLETPYWDHIVGSMNVVQPMRSDLTINIQK